MHVIYSELYKIYDSISFCVIATWIKCVLIRIYIGNPLDYLEHMNKINTFPLFNKSLTILRKRALAKIFLSRQLFCFYVIA